MTITIAIPNGGQLFVIELNTDFDMAITSNGVNSVTKYVLFLGFNICSLEKGNW